MNSEHDKAIYAIKSQIEKHDRSFDVCINVGSDKSCEYNGHYPDVVLTVKSENFVGIVMEVEDETTIDSESALNIWKSYNTDSMTLYIVVPAKEVTKMQDILQENQIDAFIGYWIESDGAFEIYL
ncbi:MAG: hypothetical protein KDC84_01090 [Crocinitomicaceae bacterium]|nr:hypothetical protein [Crocinitomicaceae bacterium]